MVWPSSRDHVASHLSWLEALRRKMTDGEAVEEGNHSRKTSDGTI